MSVPSQAGTYARLPLGEAFDVMVRELDMLVGRVLDGDGFSVRVGALSEAGVGTSQSLSAPASESVPDNLRPIRLAR